MSLGDDSLLTSYPRQRPELPPEHQAIFVEEYRSNREGKRLTEGLAKKLEAWMHLRVARRPGGPALELGAGTLNHLRFEPDTTPYDIAEPFQELYAGGPRLNRVRKAYLDIADIPRDQRYHRIISIACLEHIEDLPAVVARSGTLLAEDGYFQAGVPSEGGLLWWLGWRLTTGLSYRIRTGLDYGIVMRHEHLSAANEIAAVVRWFFEEVSLSRFPLPAHHLSFYTYLEARSPRRDRCRAWLDANARLRD